MSAKTKIIYKDKEYYCNISGDDEKGFGVFDWIWDIARSFIPGQDSIELHCNEENKDAIIKDFMRWTGGYGVENLEDYIYCQGRRVPFRIVDSEDILIIEGEADMVELYTRFFQGGQG